ncbi:hypothetical protein Dimus_008356 [Dionaea muscipula]
MEEGGGLADRGRISDELGAAGAYLEDFASSVSLFEDDMAGVAQGKIRGGLDKTCPPFWCTDDKQLMDKEWQSRYELGTCADRCGCAMRMSFGLPCADEMVELMANYKAIDPLDVHVYWRTLHIVGEDPQDCAGEAPRRSTTDDLIDEAVAKIRRQPERQKAMYAHIMHEMLHPDTTKLEEPQVRRHKGRPKQSSTKREPSGWEYSDRMYPSRQDSALLTRSMSTSSGQGRGRQGDRRVSFNCVEEA